MLLGPAPDFLGFALHPSCCYSREQGYIASPQQAVVHILHVQRPPHAEQVLSVPLVVVIDHLQWQHAGESDLLYRDQARQPAV